MFALAHTRDHQDSALFGEQILSLIGKDYVEGITPCSGCLRYQRYLSPFCQTFISIAKVRNDIRKPYHHKRLLFSVALLGLGYTLMHQFGLIGMGLRLVCHVRGGDAPDRRDPLEERVDNRHLNQMI